MVFDFFDQLLLHASYYDPRVKGDSIWIKCPFHGGGQERTPSCRINIQKTAKYGVGFYYCYGCGAHGSWNDLADKIHGLPKLDEQTVKNQDLILTKLTSQQIDTLYGRNAAEKLDFQSMVTWDPEVIWRYINGALVSDIGGMLFYNKTVKTNQLLLPCFQNKKLKGAIQCALEKKKGFSSYINTEGPWVKKTLFPYDYVRNMIKEDNSLLALVEGPRDALNLIQYGIPALCILGSKNWSSIKSDLVNILDPKLLILAFDADEAGESAFNSVSSSFSIRGNKVMKLQFKEGQDPGALKEDEVYKYKKKLLKFI